MSLFCKRFLFLSLCFSFGLFAFEANSQFSRQTTFDKRQSCEESKGIWRNFGNECADFCSVKFEKIPFCTKRIISSCDCGKNRCFDGDSCKEITDFWNNYQVEFFVQKEREQLASQERVKKFKKLQIERFGGVVQDPNYSSGYANSQNPGILANNSDSISLNSGKEIPIILAPKDNQGSAVVQDDAVDNFGDIGGGDLGKNSGVISNGFGGSGFNQNPKNSTEKQKNSSRNRSKESENENFNQKSDNQSYEMESEVSKKIAELNDKIDNLQSEIGIRQGSDSIISSISGKNSNIEQGKNPYQKAQRSGNLSYGNNNLGQNSIGQNGSISQIMTGGYGYSPVFGNQTYISQSSGAINSPYSQNSDPYNQVQGETGVGDLLLQNFQQKVPSLNQ